MKKRRGKISNRKPLSKKRVYILSENFVSFVIAGGRLARFFLNKNVESMRLFPVLWNRYDLLRFRFRLWKSFGFWSGSRQYLAVFSPFQCQNSEAAYFPESLPLIFNFLSFLLHFMLDPDPNPVPEPDPTPELSCIPVPLGQKVTVSAPQHCVRPSGPIK